MSHLTDSQFFQLLDGVIDPAERQCLEMHLARCHACHRELALRRAMAQSTKHQPLAATSAHFNSSVMRRVIFYNKQYTALRFLQRHGVALALAIGTIIIAYILSIFETWNTTKQAIENLQQEQKIVHYYTIADRELTQYLQLIGEKIINLTATENTHLLILAALIIVALALFDKYVARPFIKMRL